MKSFKIHLGSVKSEIANTASTAAGKAKLAAELVQLELKLSSEENSSNELFSSLGRLYFQDYKSGAEPDESAYVALCEELTESGRNADFLRQRISEIRNLIAGNGSNA